MSGQYEKNYCVFFIHSAKDLDDAAKKAVGALWFDEEILMFNFHLFILNSPEKKIWIVFKVQLETLHSDFLSL